MGQDTAQSKFLPSVTLTGDEVVNVLELAASGPGAVQRKTTTDDIAGLALNQAITVKCSAGGGNIDAGKMVYLNGWDDTNEIPTANLADATTVGTVALFIAPSAIEDALTGTVQKVLTLTGQNTSAGSVGDPVYLSTSGDWTLTKPTAIGSFAQRVGVVTVDSASVGEIYFDLNNAPVIETGTNQMIAGLADALWTVEISVAVQAGQKRVATVTVKDFQGNTVAAATQLVFKPTTAVSTFSVTDEGAGTGLTTSASNVSAIVTAASGIAEIGFTNDAGTIAIAFETPRGPVVQSITFT